jgi:RimJ/RimL family protein N-acetyltransferase
MSFTFQPMNKANARALLSWRYEPPYDFYNLSSFTEADISFFVGPQSGYYSIIDEGDKLVAYCCFGLEGQVPGGDYSAEALDLGLGVRPDLTGQGRGSLLVKAVLDFARQTFAPSTCRVTIAAFNQRALRVWEKAGFQPVQIFQREPDGMAFIVLTRKPSGTTGNRER